MTRVTWMIALCLAALAVGNGTAGAAEGSGLAVAPLLPAVLAPGDGSEELDPPADGTEEPQDDEADSESESDDSPAEQAPSVVEVRAAYAGSTQMRELRKMTYLATCPDVDCELSVDVELRFPGGRRVVLASPSVKLKADELDRISVRVSRLARRLMRRAARSDHKVLAVATIFSWVGTEPTPHEPIRTRLR